MRKFAKTLFVFVLPLAIVYLFTENRLSKVANSYNQKMSLAEKKAKEVEVMVLGASTALYGIDPTYFSHIGFNLANVSQSIYYDKRLAIKYINKMPNLKLIIIPVSYFSFYLQIHDSKEEWRDYFYYHFCGIEYKDLPIFDIKRYSYIDLYSFKFIILFIF